MQEENIENWRYKALKQCDALATASLSSIAAERKTICMSHFNLLDSNMSLIFLVNKSTEVLGNFIETDFVLLQCIKKDVPLI